MGVGGVGFGGLGGVGGRRRQATGDGRRERQTGAAGDTTIPENVAVAAEAAAKLGYFVIENLYGKPKAVHNPSTDEQPLLQRREDKSKKKF